jgi:hypothetical protein
MGEAGAPGTLTVAVDHTRPLATSTKTPPSSSAPSAVMRLRIRL